MGDYDDGGTVFDCGQFPANACGTWLPGQEERISANGPSAEVEADDTVRLEGSLRYGRIDQFASFSWLQLAGPDVALSDATASVTTFTAPATRDSLVFELTATDSDGRRYRDRIEIPATINKADKDGDGLIELYSLLDLYNMRHNLAGTSYKASADSAGDSSGCPNHGGVRWL